MSAIYDIAGTTSDSFMINGKTTLLQGDTEPTENQGNVGDYYFQSNGSLWAKDGTGWKNTTQSALPNPAAGVNKLVYSNGQGFTFTNVSVDAEGNIDATVKKDVPSGESGTIASATMAGDDTFKINVGGDNSNGWVELATGTNGTEPIYVRQYNGDTVTNELTLLDANGDTIIPNNLSVGGNVIVSGILTSSKPTATNSTTNTTVVTAGWVNDPAYSTNVVHRTGNETAEGNKTWSGSSTFTGSITGQTANFSGAVTAATASISTNNTTVATTQWFNNKLQVLSQAEYDAIGTKDANVFYFIKQEAQ